MPEVTFVSGAAWGDLAALAELYTESFQEYYTAPLGETERMQLIPVSVSRDDLVRYIQEEQLDMTCSPVILVDGEAAGFTQIGIRSDGNAWCKGFGICPKFRGAKLGIPLAKEMVRGAKEAGCRGNMTLGCMADNHAAKTYKATGFKVVQKCVSMVWTPAAGWEQPPSSAAVRSVAPRSVLYSDACQRLHTTQPQWNRQQESLREMKELLCLTVMAAGSSGDSEMQAYVIFRSGATDVLAKPGEESMDILDLGGSLPEKLLLLRELQSRYSMLKVNSEGEQSDAMCSFVEAGFTIANHRLHMAIDLSGELSEEAMTEAVVKMPPAAAVAARL